MDLVTETQPALGIAETTGTSETESTGEDSRTEYEGPHMIHLRQALQKTRKKCIDSLKYNTFARKYKFAHESAPHVLRHCLEEFKEQLDNMIKDELKEMITQEDLVPLFNNLDTLIQEGTSKELKQAWRPSGIPQIDIKDHLYQVKLEEKEKLLKLLDATNEETRRLKELVEKKKQHINHTQIKIQDHLQFFDKAYEACDQIPSREIQSCQMELDYI
ncbi:polyamine-modulated factor 1-like [Apostichopus japonicus]|uniref:polyamine-modulated factor 1-like n=1 Tax=Stichopus japonicus TaxID=307972 RepID=UPI003AB5BFF6